MCHYCAAECAVAESGRLVCKNEMCALQGKEQ